MIVLRYVAIADKTIQNRFIVKKNTRIINAENSCQNLKGTRFVDVNIKLLLRLNKRMTHETFITSNRLHKIVRLCIDYYDIKQ